ncbi:MAG TPA: DUF1343 domain-containing protein [Edaphocola sp.]|nr:DUF1343 domain-containing protein [Edaphocola sp.]
MNAFSRYLKKIWLLSVFLLSDGTVVLAQQPVLPGAYQFSKYLPMLQHKKVGVLVNQTSEINGILLPDTLLKLGIHVVKIFSPEHGFRGDADAGAQVKDGTDRQTGLPVVSLYGKNKKPTAEQMHGLDVVVYDIQDVGARFYTYISTLEYMMEACAEANIPLVILDRPDPLGWIVDGPVLDTAFRSFVGRQPIPVVYGMTPGEYAQMLSGEHWLKGAAPQLTVITCKNYTHDSRYRLPVMPSPNLKNMPAIYLYPSLCLFEGTAVSVGRGTPYPFQQYGHPDLINLPDSFRPEAMPGATQPKLEGRVCHARLLAQNDTEALSLINNQMQIKWLLEAYRHFPDKSRFFNSFFNTLAGNGQLQRQIIAGETEAEIRESWQPRLLAFKKIRARYLLYPVMMNQQENDH